MLRAAPSGAAGCYTAPSKELHTDGATARAPASEIAQRGALLARLHHTGVPMEPNNCASPMSSQATERAATRWTTIRRSRLRPAANQPEIRRGLIRSARNRESDRTRPETPTRPNKPGEKSDSALSV